MSDYFWDLSGADAQGASYKSGHLVRFGGIANWKARWQTLAVPPETFVAGARNVYGMAKLDQRCECYVSDAIKRPS